MFHVKHFAFYESNSRPSLPVVLSAAMILYSWLRVNSAKNLGFNEITT